MSLTMLESGWMVAKRAIEHEYQEVLRCNTPLNLAQVVVVVSQLAARMEQLINNNTISSYHVYQHVGRETVVHTAYRCVDDVSTYTITHILPIISQPTPVIKSLRDSLVISDATIVRT